MAEETIALPKSFNFNSLIGIIAVGSIMWVGRTSSNNNDALTKIETQLPYVNQSVSKLEAQLALLVTRAEIEGRFAESAAQRMVLDKRLTILEARLAADKQTHTTP